MLGPVLGSAPADRSSIEEDLLSAQVLVLSLLLD